MRNIRRALGNGEGNQGRAMLRRFDEAHETSKLGPAIAEATADIERTREHLLNSVASLRQAIVTRSDWREWVRRRPGACVIGAIAAGFVIGRLNRRN